VGVLPKSLTLAPYACFFRVTAQGVELENNVEKVGKNGLHNNYTSKNESCSQLGGGQLPPSIEDVGDIVRFVRLNHVQGVKEKWRSHCRISTLLFWKVRLLLVSVQR
jgi:hypothetical protein